MTSGTTSRLRLFADLLLRWNTTLNLIAAKDAASVWDRHIANSLQLVTLIPLGTERAIDLGTGGGFPGLVLAIATGIEFELIESDRRKASFLRTAILETAASATVHNCRIEHAPLPPRLSSPPAPLPHCLACCLWLPGYWRPMGSACSSKAPRLTRN